MTQENLTLTLTVTHWPEKDIDHQVQIAPCGPIDDLLYDYFNSANEGATLATIIADDIRTGRLTPALVGLFLVGGFDFYHQKMQAGIVAGLYKDWT